MISKLSVRANRSPFPGIHLINHESNLSHHSPIVQTTSAPYYNNLAPSAIGTSAIVSTPMLLSQSSDHQATIDSIRNQSIGGNQLIGFEPHHLTRSNQSQSTAHHQHHQLPAGVHQTRAASSRLTREPPSRNFVCKFCKMVRPRFPAFAGRRCRSVAALVR